MGLELALKLLYHNRGRKGIFTLSVLIRAPKPKTLEETSRNSFLGMGGGVVLGFLGQRIYPSYAEWKLWVGSTFKVVS